jgi:heat shock protein HslJ
MRGFILGLVLGLCVLTPSFAADLAGSEWGFENSNQRFIRFQMDGKISGHGGCNRFFGSYEIENNSKLSFSPIGSTKMACAQPVMQKEFEFFKVLENTTFMNLNGLQLSLLGKDGQVLVNLVRKDWD